MPRLLTTSWICVFVVLPFVAGAESTLLYDAPTGEVFLNVETLDNQRFAGFQINSTARNFATGNYRRLGGATDLFLLDESTIVEGGALVGGYSPGLYALGAIYPANRSIEQYNVDVSGVWATLGDTTTSPLGLMAGRPDGVPLNTLGVEQVEHWATNATLSYFPSTGDLTFSNDGFVTIFHIEGSFDSTAAEDVSVGNRFTARDDLIESIGLVPAGEYKLGPILSSGLSAEQFREAVDSAVFVGKSGLGATSIELDVIGSQVSLKYVPEPSSSFLTWTIILIVLPVCRSRR